MNRVELLTGQETFERLHKLADGKKAHVSVDRDELRRLLIDHSTMLRSLHVASGYRVIEPAPRRQRPALRGH